MEKLNKILEDWKNKENIIEAFKKYVIEKSNFCKGEYTIKVAQVVEIKFKKKIYKVKTKANYHTQAQNPDSEFIRNKELDEKNLVRFLNKFDDDFLIDFNGKIDNLLK